MSDELSLEDIDRQMAEAVASVHKRRTAKYQQLIEGAKSALDEINYSVTKIMQQRIKLIDEKIPWLQRREKITKEKDPEIAAAYRVTLAAIDAKLEALQIRQEAIDAEVVSKQADKPSLEHTIEQLEDRIAFLLDPTVQTKFSDNRKPETYLDHASAAVVYAWNVVKDFESTLPDGIDDVGYLKHAFAYPYGLLMAADTADLDDKFVLAEAMDKLVTVANRHEAPDPRAADSAPGDDWKLFAENSKQIADGILEEIRRKGYAAEVDTVEHIRVEGLDGWLSGKKVMFYGANIGKAWCDKLISRFEKKFKSSVNWFNIDEADKAIRRAGMCDLVIIFDQFAAPVQKTKVMQAAKAAKVPYAILKNHNEDVVLRVVEEAVHGS